VDTLKDIQPNRLIYVKEEAGIVRTLDFTAEKKR
jgi:hypothetical protein